MEASARFTSGMLDFLRREIADAGGNEVCALGTLDDNGRVAELRVTARGNEGAVPALGADGADVFIHNHPSGFLVPSDNDMMIAARSAEYGTGAYIVDNDVSRVYVVAEPLRRRRRKMLNSEEIRSALEEDGAVSRRLPGYERRDAQLDLMDLIVRVFNEDAVAAAEAGTGVGKSFAYILPAIEFALANDERVIISTATITLQQQLYEKDIPLVLSALGKDLKCVLVKGRGNYLCRRRLAETILEPPLDNNEYDELRAVAAWAEMTKTGSKSDISFVPDASLWSRLCCESDTCLGMHCDWREKCFFMALRRESSDARILVVNHHLLFADLAARHEGAGYESAVVLPPYTRVIIDEAHTIENAATSFFSKSFSRLGIGRALSRLYRKRRARETGLLFRLASMLPANAETASANAAAGAMAEISAFAVGLLAGIDKKAAAVRETAEKADEAALALCGAEGLLRFTLNSPISGIAGNNTDFLGELRLPLEELKKSLGALSDQVRTALETADQEDPTVWEIKAILRRLESAALMCASFLEFGINGDENEVYWLERQRGASAAAKSRMDSWVSFTITPVNIAPLLAEALFEANKTVICVSATLCTGNPHSGRNEEDADNRNDRNDTVFRFWAGRTGAALADRKLFYGIFPSPFPYRDRCLLLAPSDAPLPASPQWETFVGRAAAELALLSGGSALILFTSYQSLQAAWDEAAPVLENAGIRCLKQGDDDRTRLLQRFLADKTSVLFGTDSFWEGVDAPGETLRLVILCRLPFRTMKDPVFEARREAIEKRGRNAFTELSLPDAVMKFKQGFGRLMRSAGDYGAVAVLDGRFLHKSYGSVFLAALPETRTSFGDFAANLRDLERFLF